MKRVRKFAACYCHVTGDVGGAEESIETQKKKLAEFATAMKIPSVFFTYDDRADDRRTGFWRIVDEIKAGRVKVFAVTSLDRFSERPIECKKLLIFLKKHRVFFVALNEELDTFSPAGTKKLKLHLAMAGVPR